MSSGNPSINSPASTNNSHLPPFLVNENDQLVDDNGEVIEGLRVDVETNNEGPPLPIRPRPEAMGPLRAPPISPTSTLSILQAYGEGSDPEVARDLARQLAATVVSRSLEFEQLQRTQTAAFSAERDRLTALAGSDVRRLPPLPEGSDSPSTEDLPPYQAHARSSATQMETMPGVRRRPLHGFQHNAGHVPDFLIPGPLQQRGQQSALITAPFIRRSHGHLFAEGTANGSLIYAFPLHATPREPEQPVDSLPPWLLALLHPTSPHYDLIVQTANRDGDWGLGGELQRYREFSQQIHRAQERLDRWQAELETLQAGCDRCRFRLERARAGTRLQSLQHIADATYGYFADGEQVAPTTLRRGGARRGRGRPSR
jgi:hypothetical protein